MILTPIQIELLLLGIIELLLLGIPFGSLSQFQIKIDLSDKNNL